MQRLLKTLVAVTGVSFTLASVGCGAVPPTPGSGPVSGLAPVEEVNLLMLESFPVQVVDGRVFVRVRKDEADSVSETLPKPR